MKDGINQTSMMNEIINTVKADTEQALPKANAVANKTPKKKAPKVKLNLDKGFFKVRLIRTSFWRIGVQSFFLLTSLFIGWQFYAFSIAAKSTQIGDLPHRPPGVEGYLPISGLMGVVDWFYQGTLNNIRPAATILFIIFVLLSLFLRKSFCGWICPVGFFSENLGKLGVLMFKRILSLPKWLDIFLRGIKYFILFFFVWAIFGMSAEALNSFINSPYNRIADIKMLDFFVNMSKTSAIVIAILAVLSVVIHSFWCRYLCPYGAMMGFFAWLSPVKVRRDPEICTDCGVCDKVCPARLPVSKSMTVINVECIGCNDCVTSCPVPKSLGMGTEKQWWTTKQLAIAVLTIFFIGYFGARFAGLWHNSLTDDEIRTHVSRMNTQEYSHPR